MRRTRFGTLILATGWACFPVALVAGSFTPAVLGILLVALVVTRPAPEARDVHVERVLPEHATAGAPTEIVTRAKASGNAPLFVEDVHPDGVDVVGARHQPGRGRAVLVSRVNSEPGARVWTNARVRYQDAWGLLEDVTTVPAISYMEFLPESGGPASKREEYRRMLSVRARRNAGANPETEIEHLREYQPGDRLRDIDWAHSTKLSKLISREITQTGVMPVVVLVQADAGLRETRRVSKLATVTRVALGVASAASTASLPAGLVAWSERGLEAQVRTTSNRRVVADALLRVAELPSAPLEREGGGAAGAPVDAALAAVRRVTSHPSLVVAFVDAEASPDTARRLLNRLGRDGHRVIIVAPASGPHHFVLSDVNGDVVEELVAWRRNREDVARACAAARAKFIALSPHDTEDAVAEVIRSAT